MMRSITPARNPSELVEGKPAEMLRAMEESPSDRIHGGVAPTSWAAGAVYVNDYIMMRDSRQEDIAARFGCSKSTISRIYPRIVGSPCIDRVYGRDMPVARNIDSTLEHRRATIGMLSIRLDEPLSRTEKRVRAAEYNDNIQSERFGSRRFYRGSES